MARPNKPWFRTERDTWYATINGEKVALARGKGNQAEAERRFHALLAQQEQTAPDAELTVQGLIDAFSLRCERELKASTVKRYGFFLRSFCDLFGSVVATAVKRHQVDAWIKAGGWNGSTEATAKATLVSVYQWGIRQELVSSNPLKGIRKPPLRSRGADCLISDADHARLSDAASPALRRVLFALRETGARPGEVLSVTASDFDAEAGVWILHAHKTARTTGKPRIIVLTPALVSLCRELAQQYPEGPLFRSSRGEPWKAISVSNRVLELRKRLGIKGQVCPYSYRHTLATDALASGVPDAHVAALLGHSSTAMVSRHYGHLTARVRTLKEGLEQVRGAGADQNKKEE